MHVADIFDDCQLIGLTVLHLLNIFITLPQIGLQRPHISFKDFAKELVA